MEDSYMDQSNYDSLLYMNRIANEFCAIPITTLDENMWGVLIIDRQTDPNNAKYAELDSELGNQIGQYIRMFKEDLFLN